MFNNWDENYNFVLFFPRFVYDRATIELIGNLLNTFDPFFSIMYDIIKSLINSREWTLCLPLNMVASGKEPFHI